MDSNWSSNMKKIQISEVVKKDLKVLLYLVVFGGVTILSQRYLQAGEASVLLGAGANYVLFRLQQELKGAGYSKALTK